MWFGISASDSSMRPQKAWWCFPNEARPGDILLLYQKQVGVVLIEKLVSPLQFREMRCGEVGLKTGDTVRVTKIEPPISIKMMKSGGLRTLPAVRRNFQGTTFRVPPEFRTAVDVLLAAAIKNPKQG
jgi:hypothetical protein